MLSRPNTTGLPVAAFGVPNTLPPPDELPAFGAEAPPPEDELPAPPPLPLLEHAASNRPHAAAAPSVVRTRDRADISSPSTGLTRRVSVPLGGLGQAVER